MTSRGLSLTAKLLTALISTLFVLALAELATRLFVGAPQRVRIYARLPGSSAEGGTVDAPNRVALRRHNEQLYVLTEGGRRLRPNTIAEVENNFLSKQRVTIRTNSIGYRNPELGEKSHPRVLFLGDSITCAAFLNEEQSFVRRVEALARESGKPLETVNAGVGSIGLEEEIAILKETGLGIEPDIVVLGFYLNDVRNSSAAQIRKVPGFLEWSYLAQHLARSIPASARDQRSSDAEMIAEWREQVRQAFPPGEGDPRKEPSAFNRLILDQMEDWGSAWSDGAWSRMEPLLRELNQLSSDHGFALVFVVFPVEPQVSADFVYDHPQRRLRGLANELDVPVIDLLPVLRRAARSSSSDLFYDQCHHTADGHAVIAEEIHRSLTEASHGSTRGR